MTAYTGGRDVPSARFRVRQYGPALRALGVALEERPARLGAYPPRFRTVRPLWGTVSLVSRLLDVMADSAADVTLLQREMISGLFTVERFTRRPRVLDVDDAIWMVRGGSAARQLAQACDLVICGNQYVADHFRALHPNTVVLPTPVDTARFAPATTSPPPDAPVIGWSGTSSNLRFLLGLEDAIAEVLARHPAARLRVLCDRAPVFTRLPPGRVEWIRWSAEREVAALQGMSIGLMPLEESEWCLGKCSYKMLLYMACALPVIVTPWGMNQEVLAHGDVGLAAHRPSDWVRALDQLISHPDDRRRLGAKGRAVVEATWSLDRLGPRFAALLHGVAAASP